MEHLTVNVHIYNYGMEILVNIDFLAWNLILECILFLKFPFFFFLKKKEPNHIKMIIW